MKINIRFAAILVFIIAFCIPVSVYAESWGNFTDISGHWAEKALKVGYDDGLITGYNSSNIAPDAPITTAQMITVLCRVLGASKTADISALGISSSSWYADDAGKALYLGLISKETGSLEEPMTRQSALSMMAKAFCLIPAEPDYSVLASFSDAGYILPENKAAMATLVSGKFIQGDNGLLNVNSSVTRAEFLTVLFRIADNYLSSSNLVSNTKSSSVIKGSGSLYYISTGKLWFDCSSESVALSNVAADSVTLMGYKLSNLSISGGSNIAQLVVAVGAGGVSFDNPNNSKIGTLRLYSCDSASIGAEVSSVEITGNGIPVSISGKHDCLVISGSNNAVTLSSDAAFSKIKIIGENNSVTVKDKITTAISSCDEIALLGTGNTLSFNVSSANPSKILVGGTGNNINSELKNVASISLEGSKCKAAISSLSGISDFSVTGSGNNAVISSSAALPINVAGSLNVISVTGSSQISSAAVSGNSNWITLSCTDISSVSISGMYNTVNRRGTGKTESVKIPGSDNAFVLNNDNALQTADISGEDNAVTVNGTAQKINLNGQSTVLKGSGSVQALTINSFGSKVTLSAVSIIDNSAKSEEARVLNLVTLGYAGDYTLQWAQDHDYTGSEKVTWVNAKGYSSSTEYLIWVNLSMQRVNVFQGSAGNWTLCYSCIVGTGATGRDTPIGTWTVTYKLLTGWNTSTYTVKPVVGFKQDTGYAFHSRLYYPGTTTLSDSSIGYPISHGCVRMYEDDIQYIYNTIPFGTTVVVY